MEPGVRISLTPLTQSVILHSNLIKRRALPILTVITIVAVVIGFTSARWAQSEKPVDGSAAGNGEGVGSATLITIHGKISTVDRAAKLVTLGTGGRKALLKVEIPPTSQPQKWASQSLPACMKSQPYERNNPVRPNRVLP